MRLLTKLIRYGWAAPTSLLGLLMATILLITGGRATRVQGVLEVSGGWLANRITHLSGFAALTLGHVVLGHSADCLQHLRLHEHVHVRQAERWGIFFVPAYVLAALWQILHGRHAYRDHPFEQEAFAAESAQCSKDAYSS